MVLVSWMGRGRYRWPQGVTRSHNTWPSCPLHIHGVDCQQLGKGWSGHGGCLWGPSLDRDGCVEGKRGVGSGRVLAEWSLFISLECSQVLQMQNFFWGGTWNRNAKPSFELVSTGMWTLEHTKNIFYRNMGMRNPEAKSKSTGTQNVKSNSGTWAQLW